MDWNDKYKLIQEYFVFAFHDHDLPMTNDCFGPL